MNPMHTGFSPGWLRSRPKSPRARQRPLRRGRHCNRLRRRSGRALRRSPPAARSWAREDRASPTSSTEAPRRLKAREAADIVHAIMSPEVYGLLITDRGWTADRTCNGPATHSSSNSPEATHADQLPGQSPGGLSKIRASFGPDRRLHRVCPSASMFVDAQPAQGSWEGGASQVPRLADPDGTALLDATVHSCCMEDRRCGQPAGCERWGDRDQGDDSDGAGRDERDRNAR